MKIPYIYTCLLAIGVRWSFQVTGQCPQNKYGPQCKYDCHCGPGVRCDPQTGCRGSCAEDWLGDHCQARNIALRRPTAESPASTCRRFPGGQMVCDHSVLAVDGRRGHNFHAIGGCSHTGDSDPPRRGQWNVTFDEEYDVYRFIIDNRNDCCGWRLNGFVLSVGQTSEEGFNYQVCYRDKTQGGPYTEGPGDTIRGRCTEGPVRGDVVQVMQTNFYPLSLCEIIIYVCSPGWYGQECNLECTTTSACLRCDDHQMECVECVDDRWGEDCQKNCCCPGGKCKKNTGRCFCPAGYKGDKCNTPCMPGEYGEECARTCGHCAEGITSCDSISGECPDQSPLSRCQAGYKRTKCDQVCGEGEFGPDCKDVCGYCAAGRTVCNRTTGECPDRTPDPRCQPGYQGMKCDQECFQGFYGVDCQGVCGNCSSTSGFCHHVNGTCSSCAPGWNGSFCKEPCHGGYYGNGCREVCGNCHRGVDQCDVVTGECPSEAAGRCAEGYTGELCKTECSLGKYGIDCNETCGLCAGCRHECNRISGICPGGRTPRCGPGWKGIKCQAECSRGEFGADCIERCGQCAEGRDQCDRGTGICPDRQPSRCMPGWGGDSCKIALLNDTEILERVVGVQPETSCTGVVLGSSLAIAVTAIVVVITIIYLMRKSRDKPNPDIMLISAEEPVDQSGYPIVPKDADTEGFPKYSTLPEDEHL